MYLISCDNKKSSVVLTILSIYLPAFLILTTIPRLVLIFSSLVSSIEFRSRKMGEETSDKMVDEAINVTNTTASPIAGMIEEEEGDQQVMNSCLVHLNQIANKLTSPETSSDSCK